MRTGRLRGDLSLLHQGIEVAVGFGVRSLEGLVDVAELLQHSVYEARSLGRTPSGVTFTLLNPPLRMGAFRAVRLFWDGSPVDPTKASIVSGDAPPRMLDSIDPMRPVTLPVGRRSRFYLDAVRADPGRHRVRLELQSVAIPPLVWLEFSDDLAPMARA